MAEQRTRGEARIRRVFQRVMIEKTGKPMSQVMREEGYSLASSGVPQIMTGRKTWKELMEKYLPDEKLASKHDQLLNSKNEMISLNSLSLAYKVKGKLGDASINNIGEVNFNFNRTQDDRDKLP